MIRSFHFQQNNPQPSPGTRRPERLHRSRNERSRSHERGQRCHDIRCQEADREIREAFGRFSYR